jgi:hypothetical protein
MDRTSLCGTQGTSATTVPRDAFSESHRAPSERLTWGSTIGTLLARQGAMNVKELSSYADSPERMLLLSILFMFAVALLILSSSNRRGRGLSGGERAPAALRSARRRPLVVELKRAL